jgi:integrase
MMGVYRRGKVLWIRYAGPTGKVERESTHQNDARAAEALYKKRKREVAAGTWTPSRVEVASRMTVAEYAEPWLARQKERGVKTHRNEAQRLRQHVLPLIGKKKLTELKPKDAIALVESLKRLPSASGGCLSPRSVIYSYSIFARMCRDAVVDEILIATPCVLPSKTLPKKRDKDPSWRATAVYTRAEVEQLISDERVPEDERVFYALMFLLGVRPGEAAGRRWRDLDTEARPLGRMLIATQGDDEALKGDGVPREMPVHPVLAAVLAEWKLSGFPRFFLRSPCPDDFIVPEASSQHKRREQVRLVKSCYTRLQRTLVALGLRRRRQHDARRTLISIGRMDGCDRDILRACTHGSSGEVFDGYTTWSWEAKCREIAKIKIERVRGARVVKLTGGA